ncbi:hypothetical protein TMatcc_000640 [Talaromyces marneffei ATCC 18224]|uniref:Serine/threonine-protein kinase ppk6 n=2 Tax=Talaromyces marneffei TaxID=37727 RepID=B6QS11_TALMQ|nr:uncharacterized protein EYB26_003202 [Talaromyces marneffei]EEA20646.1 conserved hypothetical protein [Talaromyces marneffei ATCC 18224]KAE8549619.1 hypothetical protein EYB25_008141 [Talaromyces marneffei]QGA15544.1 hypothetical protein EYB26_003202 [Talaromyces marneffei]
MSADLLAEFGTNTSHAGSAVNTQGLSQTQSNDSFFDDDFDSFVSPEPTDADPLGYQGYTTTVDKLHTGAPHVPDTATLPPVSEGAEVLFDASEDVKLDGDEDDWGIFETANTAPSGQLLDIEDDNQPPSTANYRPDSIVSNASTSIDLLSLEDKPHSPQSIASQITPSSRHLQTLKSPAFIKKPPKKSKSSPKPSEDDFFGEWDDFEDGFAEKPQVKTTVSAHRNGVRTNETTSYTKTGQTTQLQSTVRPTNIPPPSVLLSVFPSLLEEFRGQLDGSKQGTATSKSEFATNLVQTLRAASRIIAGRTLRWKRDAILSQSMKIGPAQSGKSSGMKLGSVSKGESIKEEQEAVGVLEVWRHHGSAFNSIIQSAGERPVPVIIDKIRIITASTAQGALKASHACALCGLKRDERLPKLDDDAQDSFGDWWIEHWGHTDCKWFWEENSSKLHQR